MTEGLRGGPNARSFPTLIGFGRGFGDSPLVPLLGLLSVFPVLLFSGIESGDPGATVTCHYSDWSPPTRLVGGNSVGFVRFGSAGVVGRRLLVAGNDIPRFDSGKIHAPPLALLEVRGDTVQTISWPRRQQGKFTFLYPQIGSSADGKIVLVWGEPRENILPFARVDWFQRTHVYELWFARRNPRGSWQRPERLLQSAAGPLFWRPHVQRFHQDDAGRLHLTVGSPGRDLRYLSIDGGETEVREVPVGPLAIYPAVTAHDDTVHIAYISTGPSGTGPASVVWLITSTDSGRTWRRPLQVSPSGAYGAYHARIFPGRGSSVEAYWTGVATEGTEGEAIFRRTVEPWSRNVGALDSLGPISSPHSFRAFRDGCGHTHLLWHALGPDATPRLRYVRWEGTWTRIERPFEDLRVDAVTGISGPTGLRVLLWGVPDTSSASDLNARPFGSELRIDTVRRRIR